MSSRHSCLLSKQELYSEYDGLTEKWAMPLHTTSGLTPYDRQ